MKIKSVIILGAGPEQIDSYKIAKKNLCTFLVWTKILTLKVLI